MSKWRLLSSLRLISFPALTLGVVNLRAGNEVVSECPEAGGQPICQYRDGYMLRFDTVLDQVVRVWAPDGHFLFNFQIAIPDMTDTWAWDVAVDSDGTFVIGAGGSKSDIRHVNDAGLAMFDHNGIQTGFVDTKKFRPSHVSIAPDHSIWVLGEQTPSKNAPDYMVARKYSRDGELLGSFLPRSTFPAGLDPGAGGSGKIMAKGSKVAIVAMSGMNSSLRELIELDDGGNVLGRMRSDKQPVLFYALTSDGGFYGGANTFLMRFDVAHGVTKTVQAQAREYCLIGADGLNLVYRTRTRDGQPETLTMAQPGD